MNQLIFFFHILVETKNSLVFEFHQETRKAYSRQYRRHYIYIIQKVNKAIISVGMEQKEIYNVF